MSDMAMFHQLTQGIGLASTRRDYNVRAFATRVDYLFSWPDSAMFKRRFAGRSETGGLA
jgi:hypothetical protein